jgi:hypothetical protein
MGSALVPIGTLRNLPVMIPNEQQRGSYGTAAPFNEAPAIIEDQEIIPPIVAPAIPNSSRNTTIQDGIIKVSLKYPASIFSLRSKVHDHERPIKQSPSETSLTGNEIKKRVKNWIDNTFTWGSRAHTAAMSWIDSMQINGEPLDENKVYPI